MTTLQQEVTDKVQQLSPDNLEFLLSFINKYMSSDLKSSTAKKRKIGIFKGEKLYDPDYDFDELNDEITELFGAEA